MDAVLGDQLVGQIGGRVRDDRGVGVGAHWPSSYQVAAATRLACAPMAKTLVTGGSGFLGSHLVRALAERGDELRLLARRSSKLDHLDGIEFERVDRRRHRPPRGAPGDAGRRPRLPRRRPHLAAGRRPRGGLRHQPARRPAGLRGGARGRGEAGRPHLDRGRDRRREAEGHRRRDDPVRDRPPRPRLRQLQARGGARGVPPRRPRPAGGDRQPDLRARPRRPEPDLDGPGAPLLPRPDPRLRRRRAQHRRRPRRRRRDTCSPTPRARSASATSSPGATSPSTACSPTCRRISGVDAAAAEAADARWRSAGAQTAARLGLPLPTAPGGDRLGLAVVDLPQRARPSASSASSRARTRRRSRTRSPGSSPSSATAARAAGPEQLALQGGRAGR